MASLVADYGESSHGSSEDSDNDINLDKSDTGCSNERLPPPAFTDKIKNSVFVNPYLEAENAQFAVLEKHVKMVPQNNDTKNSKKICWMFKKGKCRFGKKCKFVHSEDMMNTLKSIQTVNMNQQNIQESSVEDCQSMNENKINNGNGGVGGGGGVGFDECEENCSDDEKLKRKRKKHPGLTQGLIPSNRVIKMYKKQKSENK